MHSRRIDPGDVGLVLDRDGGEDLADRIGCFSSGFLTFAKGEDRWAGA